MAANDRGGHTRRKPGEQDPLKDRDEQQEEVVEAEQETEQVRDQQQDAFGNQGVAEMLGMPQVAPGEAGLGLDAIGKGEDLDESLQFGGDDDLPVDGPLTLDDITRSWNQGTKRGKDAVFFDEPMPAEDLPPEDPELLAAIRADPHCPDVPDLTTPDGMVQPSVLAIAGDMTPWVAEALRWRQPGLLHRAVAHWISPPAPTLQDPFGRVTIARARIGAIASLLVLDGPTLRADPGPVTSAFVDLCLELAGRAGVVEAVFQHVRASETKLPVARPILEAHLADRRPSQVDPTQLPGPAAARIQTLIAELIDQSPALRLLPAIPAFDDPDDFDDDPLGIDDVLAQFTGGRPDPQDGLYDAGVQAAERLAAACARLRVRTVGLAAAIADTGDLWSSGAPTRNLLWLADQLDQEINRILQLLVEVARAAQGRQVAPKGIRNGLKRAARWIDRAVQQVGVLSVSILGGILPGLPDVPEPPDAAPLDPLEAAWADGTPTEALAWIDTLEPGLERQVAHVLTRSAGGERPSSLIRPLREAAAAARAEGREELALMLEVGLGPCLLWAEELEAAKALAERHMAAAHPRRNGTLLASAALLAIEANRAGGDADKAIQERYRAAHLAFHLGSPAAVTLLARWALPEEDEAALVAAIK